MTFDENNPSPGEQVREFYRRQGEARERERILRKVQGLLEYNEEATWSPRYLVSLIRTDKE